MLDLVFTINLTLNTVSIGQKFSGSDHDTTNCSFDVDATTGKLKIIIRHGDYLKRDLKFPKSPVNIANKLSNIL